MSSRAPASRVPSVFWVILLLAAFAGAGLLAKHYRMSRQGPIAPGPFSVAAPRTDEAPPAPPEPAGHPPPETDPD